MAIVNEESNILSYIQVKSLPVTISQMVAKDIRPQGQRQKTVY